MSIFKIKNPATEAAEVSKAYLRHGTTFDLSSIPSSPSSPPSTPVEGDIAIQKFDNLLGTERATIQWEYDGSAWVQVGHVEYNVIDIVEQVNDDIDPDAIPAVPVGHSTLLSTTYVTGDTLLQEYNNGYLFWGFDGTAWVLNSSKLYANPLQANNIATFDTTSLPTAPSTPPAFPQENDIILETYDNLTGSQRVTATWVYNGTTWVTDGFQYNTKIFSDVVVGDLDIGSLPTEPDGFTTSMTTSYLPGDTLWEEYDDGYIHWTFNGTVWEMDFAREMPSDVGGGGSGLSTFLRHGTTFDLTAIPSSPSSPPGSPITGDVVIQYYDNLSGTERATIKWSYNGTSWTQSGHVVYHPLVFSDTVSGDLDTGSLPTEPDGFSTLLSTTYVPGDTLNQEYDNGYIHWTFDGTAWVLDYAREFAADSDTVTSVGLVASFDASSIPTTPTVAPSSPSTGDVYIETFNNTTGSQRVVMRWTYNGTTWDLNGVPEYNTRLFNAIVAEDINSGALPATPETPGLATDYIPGDTLWEEYDNGYILWTRGASSWTRNLWRIIPVDTDTDTNTKTTFGVVATFNAASVPTAPTSPPGSPTTGDTYVEAHSNTTGTQRAIMRWTYNGATWDLNGATEYNTKHFNVTVADTFNPLSLPTTPDVPGAATDYVPGDTMWEEYENGYILWTRTASAWTRNLSREVPVDTDTDTNTITTFQVPGTGFNMNSVPSAPASPPGSPATGDTLIELYTNASSNQKVLIFWTYNGSAWVMGSTPHYNTKAFFATISSNLDASSLPSTPGTPGASTDYVTGDTLHETFNNGSLDWRYGTSSWTLVGSMVNPNNTYYVKATGSWTESGSEPGSPSNAPSSPKINDLLINVYDNGTRDNAVVKHWTYNGSAWVAVTDGTHRHNMLFTNAPSVTLTYGVPPTASNAATNTSYINGDVLWEKYLNGYGLYRFNNGAWDILTYGLEVGRIQDSADFLATLGPGVDGWAVVYDHTGGGFNLADI